MKLTSILLTAVTAVSAQNSACTSSDTVSIQNQGDTSVLQGCTTFTGNVNIEKQTTGTISLSGVRILNGDLTSDGAVNLTSLSADSLQAISGKFSITGGERLNAISFPNLSSVGSLALTGLPDLNSLNLAKLATAGSVSIQNTFLATLPLNLSQLSSMTIANNRMLQSASFAVASIPGSIIVQGNGDRFEIAFPNLQTAQNITIRSARSVSIPALVNVTGNLGFYENTFETLEAANLTGVQSTLAINAHSNLVNISMPVLNQIGGGFQVQNNTKLISVDFPALTRIGGAFDFYGSFDNVTLPALKTCKGGFNLQSSGGVDCSPFQKVAGPNNVIQGAFKCKNNVSNPGNAANDPTSSTNKKGSGSANVIPRYLIAAAGVVAGVMSMM